MKLYIAEKPSLGSAIADVLPKPHRKGEGCIWVGEGDCVSWCIGHLLEQAEPDAYNPRYKKWQQQDLPIIPEQWQLKVKSNTRKQLSVLRKLVKQATTLVHAGDPDREGQLLVDEVISYLGVKGKKLSTIERLLINDLNPAAVKKSLQNLRNNREFIPLSISALARSRSDWLYGINLTRASTLQGRKVGYQGVLSVGRVQTPLLGLVVRRDYEIEHFVSKPFYEVLALLQSPVDSQTFKAKWQPSEACQPYMDDEGRVLSRPLAENVVNRIQWQPAKVTSLDTKLRNQAAPLPYSLSALQIDAGKRFGMSAQQVLDASQTLYERHKLITYPRSDSRYLPNEHHSEASRILTAIAAMKINLNNAVDNANINFKSKAWNDKKVDAHHAIIPTARSINADNLTSQELKVYELIARQYLFQFYPTHSYNETKVDLVIAGGSFLAKAKIVKELGWKALIPADKQGDDYSVTTLPDLKKGQEILCLQGECIEKNTQPPKAFTDATLLAAMTGIARYVSDNETRKILKDTDGLGTEATRAGIIELLFKRNFLRRQGKQIRATEAGKGLINSLPVSTTIPDMTARWEAMLNAIVDRQGSYDDFMASLIPSLHGLIEQSSANLPVALKGIKSSSSAYEKRGKKKTARKPSVRTSAH